MKCAKSAFFYLCLILPVITLIVLIYKFGYRFPYWDEILYLPLFDKLNQGTLSIYDLFAFQNDHRPFFPRAITLTLAKLTSWNELVILYFSVAIVVLTFLIFAYIIISKEKEDKLYEAIETESNKKINYNYLTYLSICFVSLFLFSWSQMENWVWGLQLMVFITNFLFALILFILTIFELNLLTLLFCIIFATLASFSFANGLLIWFTTLPLLGYKISKTQRKQILLLLIWILCAVAVFIFYFTNYHPPKITVANTNTGIMHKVGYFLLYIGNPLSGFTFTPPWHGNKLPDINILSYVFGFLGLSLWALLLYKSKEVNLIKKKVCKFEKGIQVLLQVESVKPNIEEYFFWLSLSLFALFSGILVSFGRSGLGLGQALSSRYITISALFWCSLIGLLNFYIKNSEKSTSLFSKNKYIKKLELGILFAIFIILNFTPIFINQEWHKIARWKNLGWYALCSGYDGKLYWTDLWGNNDFISPQILQKEIFPIFYKYNLAGINYYKKEEVKKQLAKIYLNEVKYFIEKKLWKPAVCYLDTAIYLDSSISGIEELKKQIPPENFLLYEKYQKGEMK
ncbi:MAG TPA: hypothetical protein PLX23_06725 [Candidatus Hydrogenedens sp.]|nr:hypothetical protein [Candidatus Hydrogenedens sp.]